MASPSPPNSDTEEGGKDPYRDYNWVMQQEAVVELEEEREMDMWVVPPKLEKTGNNFI